MIDTPIPLNGVNSIHFDFSVALGHLKDGLRVVDVTWGTGEWLEITTCESVTGHFIVKYNQGTFSVFQPDAAAMLTARYTVVK